MFDPFYIVFVVILRSNRLASAIVDISVNTLHIVEKQK
jgi:hypothetical protein